MKALREGAKRAVKRNVDFLDKVTKRQNNLLTRMKSFLNKK